MKYIIKGMYWNAGDDIFIDIQNEDGGKWKTICLNDLMKNGIKENSNVSIVIDVEDKE